MKNKFYAFLAKKTNMEHLVSACMTTFLVTVALVFAWVLVLVGGWSNLVNTVKFAQVLSVIERVYIGEADTDAVSDEALSAMVGALEDRWSYYMTAEAYEEYLQLQKNQYTGVGITLMKEEEAFRIVSVAVDSPAERAGITADMRLVAVNGVRLGEESTADISAMMRENPEHIELITADASGTEHEFVLKMEVIFTNPVSYEMLEDAIGYIHIENFDENSADESIRAVDALMEDGATALVFDVRNNGGGYVTELCALLDYLLPAGEIFVSVSEEGKETITYSEEGHVALPMAVLVNENTYSAAEFFAAALEEYDAAVIVGSPTTGKNRSQTTLKLLDGSAIHISSKQYLTPNRVDLTAQGGLVPEITVEAGETDTQLEAALGVFSQ